MSLRGSETTEAIGEGFENNWIATLYHNGGIAHNATMQF